MSANDLATRMRHEHETVRTLSSQLQEKVAVVPRANKDRWILATKASFEHFQAHLVKHMAIEEEDGYMTEVVEQRPVLSQEVSRLAHEHGEMLHLMAEIYHEFARVMPEDHLLLRDLCLRIRALLQYVDHHEHEENLLVMSVLFDELGTED